MLTRARVDGPIYGGQMSSRKGYIATMEAQLQGWADELAALKSMAAAVVTQGSVKFQHRLEAAKREHGAVRQKFEELKNSGKDRWKAREAEVEQPWNRLARPRVTAAPEPAD